MQELVFIGMGPGDSRCVSLQAQEYLKHSEQLVVIERHHSSMEINSPAHARKLSGLAELKAAVLSSDPDKDFCVCVSGSPSFHSVAAWLCKELEVEGYEFSPRYIPAISSLEYFKAKLMSEPYRWYGLASFSSDSLHAHFVEKEMENTQRREYCRSRFLRVLRQHALASQQGVCLLPERYYSFYMLVEDLYERGVRNTRLAYGELLSSPYERLICASVEELYQGAEAYKLAECRDSLSLYAVELDEEIKSKLELNTMEWGLLDESFERLSSVPMTKSEIRAFILSRLRLHAGACCWDVGAGSGSLSVELAALHPSISVYALEKRKEAYSLLKRQVQNFKLQAQVKTILGTAPQVCENLPAPSQVFIGGGSQDIPDIVRFALEVYDKNKTAYQRPLRLVATAVTLSSLSLLYELFSQDMFSEFEVVQLGVTRFKTLSKLQLMNAQNPIFVFSVSYSGTP